MKQFLAAFLFTVLGLSSAQARNVGFEVGDVLEAVEIDGPLTVQCHEPGVGWETAYFDCYGDLLDPNEYSYFKIEGQVDATRVTLVARHQDGSTRTKSSDFDARKSRSKDRFNLWINTVMQKALLEFGTNQVTYQLEKGSRVVERGTFSVTVKEGRARHCEHDTIFSSRLSDCRSGSFMCDRYFRNQNYCQ